MPDRIERISRVSYNSSRIEPVRNYTKEERAAIIERVEKESEDRMEINKLLAENRNTEHLTFGELLDRELNGIKSKENDDGFVLDIKSTE